MQDLYLPADNIFKIVKDCEDETIILWGHNQRSAGSFRKYEYHFIVNDIINFCFLVLPKPYAETLQRPKAKFLISLTIASSNEKYKDILDEVNRKRMKVINVRNVIGY